MKQKTYKVVNIDMRDTEQVEDILNKRQVAWRPILMTESLLVFKKKEMNVRTDRE
uniref:Uncharacterized protein n=1 Tax=viral metagenome TaxID=1070528 RepID=A0A6M3JK87_9ZZZZ